MKKLIALITIVACAGLLVACGTNNSDKETTVNTPDQSISVVPADKTEVQTAQKKTVIVTAVPSQKTTKKEKTTKAPGPKKTKAKGGNIVGSWTFEGGIFVYNFKKDGTGVYTTGSEAMHFTYKTKGNKVIINYKEGGKVTMPYTVKGKTLYLKDENGDDMPYYKNKPHKNPNK